MAFPPQETVVILGTSRDDGNTWTTVQAVLGGRPVEVVNLSDTRFTAYDYRHRNEDDGFLPLVEAIVGKSFWILATPVYWYSMSAQLKMFFDRLSDLITIRKDLGRLLRGKSVAVVVSGTDEALPDGFEVPFQRTCEYLGMTYVGSFYLPYGKDDRASSAHLEAARKVGAAWIS